MEIQKMKNEMWLKIQKRVAAMISFKVTNPDDREELLSATCLKFLETFCPTEQETGENYTENEAVSFAINLPFKTAMRELRIGTRATFCAKGTLKNEMNFAAEVERNDVRDAYQPVIGFDSYEELTENGMTLEGLIQNIDPLNPMGYSDRICEAFESALVDDETKEAMRMKLEGYDNGEIAKALSITERVLIYKLQCVAVKLGYAKTARTRTIRRPVGEKWEGRLTFATNKDSAIRMGLAA